MNSLEFVALDLVDGFFNYFSAVVFGFHKGHGAVADDVAVVFPNEMVDIPCTALHAFKIANIEIIFGMTLQQFICDFVRYVEIAECLEIKVMIIPDFRLASDLLQIGFSIALLCSDSSAAS